MYIDPDKTYKQIEARHILQPVQEALRNAGITSANIDARCMLGMVLGREDPVLPHERISLWKPDQSYQLDAFQKRRQAGEPISRMRGWREFWSMRFDISSATLDPRPESEILIEAAIGWARHRFTAPRILDLGTGSGCLLLACLAELPQATGVGIDISAEALGKAEVNANRHGLAIRSTFHVEDFATDLTAHGQFDVILVNPPYIPSSDIEKLDADVRHFDPLSALDGGQDGLDYWRILCPQIVMLLKDKVMAFVEIGSGQRGSVSELGVNSKLRMVASFADLAGHDRCLQFQKEL